MNEKELIKAWVKSKREDIYANMELRGVTHSQLHSLIHEWKTGDVDKYRVIMNQWGLESVDMLILSDLEECHKWIYFEQGMDDGG